MSARINNILRIAVFAWPILIVVALLWAQVVPCWYVTPDSAVYLELGKNLAQGRGYVYNDERYFIYPPVFPAMLALGIRLFGDSIVMMRAVMVVAALGFLGAAFCVLRGVIGWRWAWFLTLLFGLSSPFVTAVTWVLSDLPGCMMAVLALLAVARFERVEHRRGRVGVWTAVAAALMLLAVATRFANLGLLVGIALYLFVLRRHRPSSAAAEAADTTTRRSAVWGMLPIVLVPLLFVGLWFAARSATTGPSYRSPFAVLLVDEADWDSGYVGPAGLAWRVLRNAGIGLRLIGTGVVGAGEALVGKALSWAVTALFVVGFCVKLVQRRGVVESFMLGMLGVSLATPYPDQAVARYLLPLGPFVLLYAYEGVAWLVAEGPNAARRLGANARTALGGAVGLILLTPVVLSLAGLRPFGEYQHPLGSPRLFALAVAVAGSMLFGLIGPRRLSFRALAVPACAGLLLAVWAHHATFGSVVWVLEQRDLARRGVEQHFPDDRFVRVAAELRRRADPGDVVVSGRPTLLRGLTGLKAFWFPLTRDEDAVLTAFDRGEWIVVDLDRRGDLAFGAPVLEAHPERFSLVVEVRDEQEGSRRAKKPVQLWRCLGPDK